MSEKSTIYFGLIGVWTVPAATKAAHLSLGEVGRAENPPACTWIDVPVFVACQGRTVGFEDELTKRVI